jgi:hypothetical protein
MLRIVAPTLFALACAACAAPATPTDLVGRYVQARVNATDAPAWRALVGDWTHEYRADGHLIVQQIGGMHIETRYRIDGDILTLDDIGGSGSCRPLGVDVGSARYRVHFIAGGVRFEALRDECMGRRTGMTIHPWLRVP